MKDIRSDQIRYLGKEILLFHSPTRKSRWKSATLLCEWSRNFPGNCLRLVIIQRAVGLTSSEMGKCGPNVCLLFWKKNEWIFTVGCETTCCLRFSQEHILQPTRHVPTSDSRNSSSFFFFNPCLPLLFIMIIAKHELRIH